MLTVYKLMVDIMELIDRCGFILESHRTSFFTLTCCYNWLVWERNDVRF